MATALLWLGYFVAAILLLVLLTALLIWIEPDLTIAGAYDLPAFRTLMREGVAPGGKKLGLMREVARDDFRHFTDKEIAAIHAFMAERASRAP